MELLLIALLGMLFGYLAMGFAEQARQQKHDNNEWQTLVTEIRNTKPLRKELMMNGNYNSKDRM